MPTASTLVRTALMRPSRFGSSAFAIALGALSFSSMVTNAAPPRALDSTTRTGVEAAAAPTEWLDIVNAYRTSTGLPAVTRNAALQTGVDAHVRYLAATGSLAHGEDPGSPAYTAAGHLSATQSMLGGWAGADKPDRDLIEGWVSSPFHLVHLLEPRWQSTAFAAIHNEPGSVLASAAVLNVTGGIGKRIAIGAPILFPGPESTVPPLAFLTETPNPLVACPGYSAPAGQPIEALFPTGPGPVTSSITADGRPVEHCLIDASFTSPSAADQSTVRSIFTQKHAVALLPRAPLPAGTRFDVTLHTGSGDVSWWFTTGQPGGPLPSASPRSPLAPSTGANAGRATPSKRLPTPKTSKAAKK